VGLFSINTNIASLQAQNYLATDEMFQNQTINEVTSGLRIVNSGNDAAGLAIANSDRSNEAVLTQGIQNANNGLATLQTADGGLSNISQLLDRARTLATESASGAFTGDRGVLNSEFQSVIQEVNRQAQAIGLNQGGEFATSLNVFVGGGTASGNISASENGTVSVNLSTATVDAKSLGLEGVQASGVASTDIGNGSTTSVQDILNNTSNQASISNNTTDFTFTGPGFANTTGSDVIKVAVNLTGVTNSDTLVTAINQAITNAGNSGSQQATAFQNANITAAINVDSSGKSQLTFNSPNAAFQVQGGDQIATALLGSFSSGSTGNVASVSATAGQAYAAPATDETVNIRLVGAGLTGAQGEFNVVLPTTITTGAEAAAAINAAIATAGGALAATGITASASSGGVISFNGAAGQSFQVQTAGDANNSLGFGTYAASTGYSATGGAGAAGVFDYDTITAAAAALHTAGSQNLQVSLNGGATIDLGAITVAATGSAAAGETAAIDALNTAFNGNAATRAAGLEAGDNGSGDITISSATSTNFRVNLYGGTNANQFGFGNTSTGVGVTATAVGLGNTASEYSANNNFDSQGAQASVNADGSQVYRFTGLTNAGDAQTITLSAVDAQGNQHSLNVALNTTNASTLDQTVATINTALLASNDSTLNQIAAFKQTGTVSADVGTYGQEGIEFQDATGAFKVSLGASPLSSTAGVSAGFADGSTGTSGGAVLGSVANGTGSTADISNIATATAAVNQLANSVQILGDAQAAVGRGENQFTYATNLANSQLTNLAAAESDIRDANMATESANLTKASIQLQAGIAALAQANSAPQQILKLLQQ
jgi:flagellin